MCIETTSLKAIIEIIENIVTFIVTILFNRFLLFILLSKTIVIIDFTILANLDLNN